MRRINLPLIADTLFTTLCTFFLFFTAVRFYTRNAAIALVTAIAASLGVCLLTFIYISRKQNRKLLLSRDEKQKTLLSLHLSLSSDEYIKELFKKCFDGAQIRGNRIICGDVAYFCRFKMQPLSEDDIAEIIKNGHKGEKRVLCVKVSPQAAALAENFAIKTTGIDGVFTLLKQKELMPDKFLYEGKMKVGLFKRIKARFNRKLCAPLFFSGAALLALSYFTFFPLYYIISGGTMLLLSAVTLFITVKPV